ncbi:hypothetical protein [Archangium sp.]|uniref:type II toxin-antitoxin system RelE family toxin n=1 Tax=Archangium sp. TaxID=1872627 RepID=UPI002D38FCAF|nr:hypothetical protein [Archangium sp.]HYO58931.1 hypothetical protein [Archangium sp.]
MRQPGSHTASSNHTAGYAVEISSAAWKQLSLLPLETYQRVRSELDAIAARLGSMGPTTPESNTASQAASRGLVVGDYLTLYDVDSEHRRIVLLKVERADGRKHECSH